MVLSATLLTQFQCRPSRDSRCGSHGRPDPAKICAAPGDCVSRCATCSAELFKGRARLARVFVLDDTAAAVILVRPISKGRDH